MRDRFVLGTNVADPQLTRCVIDLCQKLICFMSKVCCTGKITGRLVRPTSAAPRRKNKKNTEPRND